MAAVDAVSDAPPSRPLFPPRPPEPAPPPSLGTADQIERAVVDTFSKHFGQTMMPYGQARLLVRVERDLISELVRLLA